MKATNTQPEVSAPRVLEELVRDAQTAGASDIHLQMLGRAAEIRFRLDGVMTAPRAVSEDVAERVFGRIKFLAKLKTYQESLPQDGRIEKSEIGSRNDIRVATYPTVTGEKIVLRLFQQDTVPALADLGLPEGARQALERFLKQTSGLLLLTGPSGSGKTTTIYACLKHLAAQGGRHIITVEDPVEQILPGIMQTEVNDARGLTFAVAARHLLRQDPQVLVIGEIRDEDTANIALRAALTGHLVITTLHAGSCQGVFERLWVLCKDRQAVPEAVSLVLNQRLLRRLCADCRGRGCVACLQTGYRGRMPTVEWAALAEDMRRQLQARGPEAVKVAPSLRTGAEDMQGQGITNRAEVERVFGE